jgi:hypothetical protein
MSETKVVDTFKLKSKRKSHPNAERYPGRPSMTFGTALRKFMYDLDNDQLDKFQEGRLVVEDEASAEFFDGILVGDVVGLGILKGIDENGSNPRHEPAAYQFKILDIDRKKDLMKARNVTWEDAKRNPDYQGIETEIAFEDLSVALGMGFGEILERDGKPFGVSEEIEMEVRIHEAVSGSKDVEAGQESEVEASPAIAPAADIVAREEKADTAQ